MIPLSHADQTRGRVVLRGLSQMTGSRPQGDSGGRPLFGSQAAALQTAVVTPDESKFFPVELQLQEGDDLVVWCSAVTIAADAVEFVNGRAVRFGFTNHPEGVTSIPREKVVGEIKVHPRSSG
jgi:hypothetical protein